MVTVNAYMKQEKTKLNKHHKDEEQKVNAAISIRLEVQVFNYRAQRHKVQSVMKAKYIRL